MADTPNPTLTVKPEVSDSDTALLDGLLADKPIEPEPEPEPEPELEVEPESESEVESTEQADAENIRGVDWKRLKEKYPDFAKTNDYRELRNSYHREAEYTTLFPTVEDAREAAENNQTFSRLNDALVNANDPLVLLQALQAASPDTPKKVAHNFLPAVERYDQNLYLEIVSPIVHRIARQIYYEGQRYLKKDSDSEQGHALIATARNITEFAFNDAELAEKDIQRPQQNQPSQREHELNQREHALRLEKWQGAYNRANSSVERNLDKQILSGLDPDGKMNEFTRDTLLDKIKTEVKDQIARDGIHMRRMNSLWTNAERNGYNDADLSRIVSAYLERARSVIPAARSKYKSIALRGSSGNREGNVKVPSSGTTGRPPVRDGRTPRIVDPRKIDYSNTSDNDIFEGRVKLKG